MSVIISILAALGIAALFVVLIPPVLAIGGVAYSRAGGFPPFSWYSRWMDYWVEWHISKE